jgi:LuxR family maltose regulon positive regulatory protein
MAIKVLLTDTQSMLAAGVISILGEDLDITVLGDNYNVRNLDEQISEIYPDVVLIDLTANESKGIQLIRNLDGKLSSTKLLVINAPLRDKIDEELTELGVSGIISKERVPEELLSTIHKLARAEKHSSPIQSKSHSRENQQDTQASIQLHLPVLYTKLHRPRVSDDHILRSDIIEIFEKNREKPLSLVSAPAGYGKSLTVSQWLDQTSVKSAWISLDEEHNDLRVFLMYLHAAIEKVFPGALKDTNTLIGAKELPPLKVIAYSLINEIDQIEDNFILVLDDYHRIHNKIIHNLLDEILTYPPESLHICISTRIDPPLKLNSLLANGRMSEIRMKRLAFSKEEIIHLYQKLIHIEVQVETAKSLYDKTEGWIVGLRMASLLIHETKDADKILSNMKGDIHSLSKYLLEEVLMRQPQEYQEMLLITSVLDRFCPELVASISAKVGGPNGDEFVFWLIKSNLFVISLDNQGIWFRYHHLIQELLQKLFQDHNTSSQIASAHVNASNWFEKNGFIDEAIHHALAGGKTENAIRVLEKHRDTELNKDRWYVVQRWFDMLPNESKDSNANLLLTRAWIAHEQYEHALMFEYLNEAESFMKQNEVSDSLKGELFFWQGIIQYYMGNGDISLQLFENARNLIPGNYTLLEGQIVLHLNLARYMCRKEDVAFSESESLIKKANSSGNIFTIRVIAGIAFIHMFLGDLFRLKEVGMQMQGYTQKSQFDYSGAFATYFQGYAHLHTFNLDEASVFLARTTEQRYINHIIAALNAMAGLALAQQLSGKIEAANATITLLEEFVHEMKKPEYMQVVNSCKGRIALLRGDLSSAIHLAELITEEPAPSATYCWLEVPCISKIRILIAEGSQKSLEIASDTIQKIIQISIDVRHVNQLVEITTLKVLLLNKQENGDEAIKTLEEVIALAEPGGWIRPFVEAGPDMLVLLKNLKNQREATEFINNLIDSIEKYQQDLRLQSTGKDKPDMRNTGNSRIDNEQLSVRELEITKLLAAGLRNKEIANKLFVSEGTIKKHIYNICQKWKIHSRLQLIQNAGRMGYI